MFKTHKAHGHAKTKASPESKTYKAWTAMKQRCTNANTRYWHRYGGRGISYDPRWEDFSSFLADMGERPPNTSLDRINNDGNYTKSNCRWATTYEQANNRKHPEVKYAITLHGVTKALSVWCSEYNVKYHTALWRLHKGWPIEELFGEAYVSYHK